MNDLFRGHRRFDHDWYNDPQLCLFFSNGLFPPNDAHVSCVYLPPKVGLHPNDSRMKGYFGIALGSQII
jgi:hypothetical protein